MAPQRKQPRNFGSPTGFIHARTRKQCELMEDYVELIDDLIIEKGEARAVDVARCLGVSHVTVSKTIGRLKDAGLVRAEPYRSIFLTEAGHEMACASRQRHRVVVEFLLALGIPRATALIDAEGIEHHVSDETLAAMKQFAESGLRSESVTKV